MKSHHFFDPIIGSWSSPDNIFWEIWAADTHFIHHNYVGFVPANWKSDKARKKMGYKIFTKSNEQRKKISHKAEEY